MRGWRSGWVLAWLGMLVGVMVLALGVGVCGFWRPRGLLLGLVLVVD